MSEGSCLSDPTPLPPSQQLLVPDYHQPQNGKSTTWSPAAARASWITPIVVLFLATFAPQIRGSNRIAAGVFALFCIALSLAALIFAVLALFSIPRQGRQGILSPAIIGLILNGIFLTTVGAGVLERRRNVLAKSSPATGSAPIPENTAAMYKQAFEDHSGWIGRILHTGTSVLLIELPDDSPFIQDFRSQFTREFSAAQLNIHNADTAPLVVDLDSLVILFPSGRQVHSLPMHRILASAKTGPEKWLARWDAPWTIAPGATISDGFIFLPLGTSMLDAVSISIEMNGRRVPFDGRIFTVQEKLDLLKKGEMSQGPQKSSPAPASPGRVRMPLEF